MKRVISLLLCLMLLLCGCGAGAGSETAETTVPEATVSLSTTHETV